MGKRFEKVPAQHRYMTSQYGHDQSSGKLKPQWNIIADSLESVKLRSLSVPVCEMGEWTLMHCWWDCTMTQSL